ncbi:Uncharacterized protein Adt_41069 [Abeliophyllum distichum]|uniref:Retroviral polymerase SH3-like domain-containing protein n=1 Tax=Abeliophyllum distichum TaxID=126358 RepID=A0ABD1PPB9_9LAMI
MGMSLHGGGVAYNITSIGDVTVRFDSGVVHILKGVRYILYMGRNLIYVEEMEKIGFFGVFGNGMLKMTKCALRAFKAVRKNGIYIVRTDVGVFGKDQDGVAERMNRTLLDKVRCMMLSSGVPKSFWSEAVMTACYLTNLTPSTALNGDTPYKKWHDKCADYTMPKTFGSTTFSHQSEEKLEPRARKCVFLGYPKGVKRYKLWDRNQNGVKIIISRYVKFNESEMPCLESEKQQETISGESLVDVERVSTALPISPSEVESDNQQDQQIVENERDEDVIEDRSIDHTL